MNNLETKIEKIKNKAIQDINKAIEKYENENVSNDRWRGAEFISRFYYITESGEILDTLECNNYIDDYLYKTRNYFKTRKETEKQLEKNNTYWELADLAENLNKNQKINWMDSEQKKYKINYDYRIGLELQCCIHSKDIGSIYCLDKNFLDISKKKIGEERLKELFG